MTVSKVFKICNAYETGIGHGQKKDGLSAGPYSDPELNEAYIEGYRHGCVLAKDKTCLNCKFEPEWTHLKHQNFQNTRGPVGGLNL